MYVMYVMYGLVWHGMVWYGMIRYGMVCMYVFMYVCMYVQRYMYIYKKKENNLDRLYIYRERDVDRYTFHRH